VLITTEEILVFRHGHLYAQFCMGVCHWSLLLKW